MSQIKFTNFAHTKLAAGITDTDTIISVTGGQGDRFPVIGTLEYFYATLENASLIREIVKVTARAGDTFTVVRGQDNTTAVAWNAGDTLALRLNAAAIEDALNAVATGTVSIKRFSGDGVTTVFTLDDAPAVTQNVDVFIGGVYQNHNTFSVSGVTLTFTEAPTEGTDNIETRVYLPVGVGSTNASLVTYTPAGTGAVATNVQAKLRESVSVKDYIPAGTNTATTDCAAYIQAADTYAGANGKVLVFDGVDYLIQSPLTISAPWVGTPRKTRIVVGTPFTFPAPTFDPRNYSAITNKNCATAFNLSTADAVFIDGIDFLNNATNVIDIVALANVKNGEITNCNFTTGTSAVCNLLDLFACVKNVKVEKCEIRNLTQNATGGGGIWIRNITSNGALAANDTENIQVVDCYFEQTSLDEALAVYGVFGMTKNVRVSRCTFNGTVASAQRHGNLVTAFPLGNNASAAVQDIVFSECRFESNNFTNTVFRAGQTADASRVCKDIRVENCYFKASLPTAGTSAVARNIPCVGGNVTFINNIIDADGSTNQITYGVQQFNVVTNSTVSGNLGNAFFVCALVDACVTKSITGTAAFNCARVSNCVLSSAGNCVVGNETARYDVLNNRIEVTTTTGVLYGVLFNSVASSAPFGEITGNIISLNNASAFAMRVIGTGAASTRVNNNCAVGTGKTASGGPYKELQGNNWYGTLDSLRSAGYLDFDHNNATPLGTYATAITHTAGTSRRLLGFIKILTNGNSGDWVSVFTENANN